MADRPRQADISPPPGWPGGVCYTVGRIQENVKDPLLGNHLIEKVEQGQALTNSEATKVYDLEMERGVSKTFSRIKIGPHAQYRMDLRSVTVGDLKVALRNFLKQLLDWKSQHRWEWEHYSEMLGRSEPIEWLDKNLGDLVVVFAGEGPGVVKIVTSYWKGMRDPKAPPSGCQVRQGSAGIPEPGYKTLVHQQHPTKSDTGDSTPSGGGGDYPRSGLPSPSWSRSKPTKGPTTYNVPGPSGTGSDGKTIHKDKARTQGQPGSGPPITEPRSTPVRRPGLAGMSQVSDQATDQVEEKAILALFEADANRQAGMTGPPFPPANLRQRDQRGRADTYDRKQYRRHRGNKLRKMKQRHKRLRNNTRYKLDRKRRKEYPEKFERKPSGGATDIATRSQKERDKRGENPQEVRQQQKYRAPREKKARVLQSTPFLWLPTNEEGTVRDVSPVTGTVNVFMRGGRSLMVPLDDFLDGALIDEWFIDPFFAHLDFLFGRDDEAEGLDAQDVLPEVEEPDTLFDEWLARKGFQIKYRTDQRQKKQRGVDKFRAKRNYVKNRNKYRLKSKKRYTRMKKNPAFKKQQQIRKQHPERFKRRTAQHAIAPDIALVLGEDMRPAVVHSLSPMTEMVTVHLVTESEGSTDVISYNLDEFFDQATFLTPEDEEAMFDLLDSTYGLVAGVGAMPSPMMSEIDRVAGRFLELHADVLYEKRPPEMEPGSFYDRATDHGDRLRQERKPGDKLYQPEVREAPGSSKVIPDGHDFENRADRAIKHAAQLRWQQIPYEERQTLLDLVHSPLWEEYMVGIKGTRDVVEWLNKHGFSITPRKWREMMPQIAEMRLGGLRMNDHRAFLAQSWGPTLREKQAGTTESVKTDCSVEMSVKIIKGGWSNEEELYGPVMFDADVALTARIRLWVNMSTPYTLYEGRNVPARIYLDRDRFHVESKSGNFSSDKNLHRLIQRLLGETVDNNNRVLQ